jgi:protein-disulfide isomerase
MAEEEPSMIPMIKTLTGAGAAALLMLTLPVGAQEFSAPQKSEIERIVKDYLVSHPEVLQEAIAELDKRQAAADLEKAKTAVANNAEALFNSSRHVVLGNPKGDVTMVEFFDYNCGFCKRAMADMLELLKDDPKLRVILKEFPVLGPGSVEAAKVAVAVRMQDKGGKKYLDFHQKLLGGRGQADKARALAVAKEVGMDMKRIDADMASDEAKVSIEESLKLAETLGLNGTPSYIVGTDVVIGAVGLDALRAKVSTARCGKAVC